MNTINTQTPDQDCLSHSDSDSYTYETNQTQIKTQTHILLNKRYEELRTQILELGSQGSLESLESLGAQSPLSPSPSLSPSSATQWWDQWERKSGQIGEEFNIITQQGMASWLEVWLELKPIIRAGVCDGDRNIDVDTQKKSNEEEGCGGQDRGDRDRDSGMILDYPGALVGILSDMVLNAVNVAHLNNKYKYNHNT
jgi:hypothetical protein